MDIYDSFEEMKRSQIEEIPCCDPIIHENNMKCLKEVRELPTKNSKLSRKYKKLFENE